MSVPLLRSTAFVRAARRHIRRRPEAKNDLELTLELLSEDPFHPKLKTHRLKGSLSGAMACSASYDLRIVFEMVIHNEASSILLLTVGSHDEVY